MADDKNGGPNHLRAWREFMKLTQEQLANLCEPPTTGAVISLLEEGERGLSLKWLRRLAPALKTRPGFIAEYDPKEVDTRTLEMISDLAPAQLAKVEKFVVDYIKDGTNG
ncbi:helix-turn-helix domain-containing protein [Novosphingobium sp. EMRT-2]|uniref:helix-turn-helix domain-containing protein n=1 Tax=Novosphingobium sp. EMRT-2 TaxID=2571749 RepID=UPI00143DFE2D|nr:helix-turn-helix transcriptional regulator [Novosphingobium sp. EMRT-2]